MHTQHLNNVKMSITSIARNLFTPRLREIEKYATRAAEIQARMLHYLTDSARHTEYGRRHIFKRGDDL